VDWQHHQEAGPGTTVERWRVPQDPGADLGKEGTEAMKRVALFLGVVLLAGCAIKADPSASSACRDGGTSCAAAQTPPGMRQVLKGHRMVRAQWVEKTNKESGVPDIGVKAEWAPITVTR